jgi:polyisoprenoid-binding protein YceI
MQIHCFYFHAGQNGGAMSSESFGAIARKPVFGASLLAFGVALLSAGSAAAQMRTWQINTPESAVQFTARHMMVTTIGGGFSKFSGTVQYDPKDVSKTVIQATIDTDSENSGVQGRDQDLHSPHFLDVAKYPTMTFQSKRAEAVGEGKIKVTGDLTLHGVTKEVVLNVEGPTPVVKDARGREHMGASATATINRKDFGILYNPLLDNGGAIVSNEIGINLQIELYQGSAPQQ